MKPCKRRDFINKLRKLGFDGPFSGSKHQFMIFQNHRLAIPSNDEYSIHQVKIMVREVQLITGKEIKNEEWENL
ncbi:MAG: type II toxin-antitoxin system HicA family toxin [Ignavibacteriae bacterium]|nr:type II toxin-antitoxin system HicA family toxin [Ignavibacteriota bacterium]